LIKIIITIILIDKMPKKKKAGKNSKNKKDVSVARSIIEPDIDSQVYGFLEKALGNRFFNVNCLDGKTRRCKVRKKRMRVLQGDLCIVSLRDWTEKEGDIIHKYYLEEVRQLQRSGKIPSSSSLGIKKDINEDEDDCVFDFDSI